jgi:hypothetical protein
MSSRTSEECGCRLDRRLIVTTSGRPTPELLARAQAWAERLGVPLVSRQGSLAKLVAQQDADGALVITPDKPIYREPANGLEYFFHPAMARLRLHNCKRGHDDPLLRAMGLQEGDSVLDCTLGRATDAVLCAWRVGPQGRVRGLEKSRLVAELTRHGLQHHVDPSRELTGLLRRIEVVCADYNEYLAACPSDDFEAVYFDPIFHEPVEQAPAMAPLRALADPSPLSPQAVQEARRVARRTVVIKQKRGTPLWDEIPVDEVVAGASSHVEYGVLR